MKRLRFLATCLGALLLMALLDGCATNKVDWAGRMGNYTFDQAILELGPPDKQAKLNDGAVVADWITHRGYHTAYVTSGYYGGHYGHGGPWIYAPYAGPYAESYSPDYYLRLTFGPDGKLMAWRKFSK